MARGMGNVAEVYLATNKIGQVVDCDLKWGVRQTVKSRALNESVPSVLGLGSADNPTTLTITVERDPADTNGQIALNTARNNGTTVSVKYYPEGKTTGNAEISGTAYVLDRGAITAKKNTAKETTYVLEFTTDPTEGVAA
jgi:hypothetical protein